MRPDRRNVDQVPEVNVQRRCEADATAVGFGGLDTTTREAFLVEVMRRDAATLLPIIQQHVAPGTTIWSDQRADYTQITVAIGLQHAAVNHSIQIVNYTCAKVVKSYTDICV